MARRPVPALDLGFGSGDLVIEIGGAHAQQIDVPNVLFVGEKPRLIQQMLQEREVVKGQPH